MKNIIRSDRQGGEKETASRSSTITTLAKMQRSCLGGLGTMCDCRWSGGTVQTSVDQ